MKRYFFLAMIMMLGITLGAQEKKFDFKAKFGGKKIKIKGEVDAKDGASVSISLKFGIPEEKKFMKKDVVVKDREFSCEFEFNKPYRNGYYKVEAIQDKNKVIHFVPIGTKEAQEKDNLAIEDYYGGFTYMAESLYRELMIAYNVYLEYPKDIEKDRKGPSRYSHHEKFDKYEKGKWRKWMDKSWRARLFDLVQMHKEYKEKWLCLKFPDAASGLDKIFGNLRLVSKIRSKKLYEKHGYKLEKQDSIKEDVKEPTQESFSNLVVEITSPIAKVINESRKGKIKKIEGMVYIPAGPFPAGTPEGKQLEIATKLAKVTCPKAGCAEMFYLDRFRWQVYIKGFYIDKYEVTNKDYLEFVNFVKSTGYKPPRTWKDGKPPKGKEKHPVVGVFWDDACAYAKWKGKRLPLSMEWEKAARGLDGRIWPWGNKPDKDKFNCFWSKIGDSTPVGKYEDGKSPYGCYDMAGNAWEWVQDNGILPAVAVLSQDKFYIEQFMMPLKPLHVIRGGHWTINHWESTRAAQYWAVHIHDTHKCAGFRCVKSFE